MDVSPSSPYGREETRSPERCKDLIIPEFFAQTPSPTKEQYPIVTVPGSPPPQRARAGIAETSGLLLSKQQQKRAIMQFQQPESIVFPFVPPMITLTANTREIDCDIEFSSPSTSKAVLKPNKLMPNTSDITYLSPFSMCARVPCEGNVSSSGYSSMASPGPSRCASNNKLCTSEIDSTNPSLPSSITNSRCFQSILKKSDECEENDCFRKRSDSETLSDETLVESNDEGIGTDHIDEKIEDGGIKSAKDLEVFIERELLANGRSLFSVDELQLPSIVIQSELCGDKLSPVSSRSESPISDRNIGMTRFSLQFYGKKDQQLPFTDSDGLYDFPSSDGKGGLTHPRKRRERKLIGPLKSRVSKQWPKEISEAFEMK